MPPTDEAPSIAHQEKEGHEFYTVKITDSYKKIAKSHHITVAELKAANHIKGDTLHTGQKLIIPSGKMMVAKAESTSLDESPATSVLSEAPSAQTAVLTSSSTSPMASSSHGHYYTVVKGDTLSKIAHKFKTTTAALMSENNITDPAKLSIGKKLKIPSRESRSAGNSEPAPAQPGQVPVPPTQQVQTQTQQEAPSGELATFSL
jgi:LysM repeat protein